MHWMHTTDQSAMETQTWQGTWNMVAKGGNNTGRYGLGIVDINKTEVQLTKNVNLLSGAIFHSCCCVTGKTAKL